MRELLEIISTILPLEYDSNTADKKTTAAFFKTWMQAGELIHRLGLEIDFIWGTRTRGSIGQDQRLVIFISLIPLDATFLEKLNQQLNLCIANYDTNHPEIHYDYVQLSAAITFVLDKLTNKKEDLLTNEFESEEEKLIHNELTEDFILHADKVAQCAINALALKDENTSTHLELLLSITERRYGSLEAKNLKLLIPLCSELLQRYRDHKLPLIEKTVQTKYPQNFALYFSEPQETKENVLFRIHNDILNRTLELDEAQVDVIRKYRFFQDMYYTLVRLMDPAQRAIEIKEKIASTRQIFLTPSAFLQTLSLFGIQSMESKFLKMLEAYQPITHQEHVPQP